MKKNDPRTKSRNLRIMGNIRRITSAPKNKIEIRIDGGRLYEIHIRISSEPIQGAKMLELLGIVRGLIPNLYPICIYFLDGYVWIERD